MFRRVSALALFVFGWAVTSASAAVIRVPAGGDFQQALNQAQPGDTIQFSLPANPVIVLSSGELTVTVAEHWDLTLTGPVSEIGRGRLSADLVEGVTQ